MKAAPVVAQLSNLLPQFTSFFNESYTVQSLTRSGTTMTCRVTEQHGLAPGDPITITGADTPLAVSSFTRVDEIGTIVTTSPHDRTFPSNPYTDLSLTAEMSGAVEPEFNGTFTICGITNRNTIQVRMDDSGPLVSTGTLRLAASASSQQSYNHTFAIDRVDDPTSFTFAETNTALLDPTGTIVAKGPTRVSAAASLERAVASYTQQQPGDAWMWVIIGDVTASKDRANLTDFVANLQPGNHFRQQIEQPVALYVFLPATDEIAGRVQRDDCEDIFAAIAKSLLGARFDSGMFAGENGSLQFLSHGTTDFNAGVVYVHEYLFSSTVELVFEDTVGPVADVAFRDIDLTVYPSGNLTKAGFLTVVADLDEDGV